MIYIMIHRTILTMMIRVILIVSLVCMALGGGGFAIHQTGSDEIALSVVSTFGLGGPGDETGSVVDGDAIMMASECRDSERGTLVNIHLWRVNPQLESNCVMNHPTVLYLMRGCLPLICTHRGGYTSWTVRGCACTYLCPSVNGLLPAGSSRFSPTYC